MDVLAILVVVNQRDRRLFNRTIAASIAAERNGQILIDNPIIDGNEGELPRGLFLASRNPENGQRQAEADIKPLV